MTARVDITPKALEEVRALRVGPARKLIARRKAVSLLQAAVTRRTGIRTERLNRIEQAKVTADTDTVAKIVRLLMNIGQSQADT